MARFVMKFGGTSVASIQLIEKIADRVVAATAEGHQVIVVVSAMGHETDRLVELANQVDYSGL